MEYEIYNYKNAKEIIEHPDYVEVSNEIEEILQGCPVFTFRGKSANNENLDVSQIIINRYFDYEFTTLRNWDFHPEIVDDSGLQADFRKEQNGKQFQIEIQFGNMSRWYSDVFKFQIANIYGLTDIGISVVPKQRLGARIGSNITYFERCIRELPHIKHLLHLPILLIGLDFREEDIRNLWDLNIPFVNEHRDDLARFNELSDDERAELSKVYKSITKKEKARRIISAVHNDLPMNEVTTESDVIDLP